MAHTFIKTKREHKNNFELRTPQEQEDRELHQKYGFVRLNARQFVKCSKRCCMGSETVEY